MIDSTAKKNMESQGQKEIVQVTKNEVIEILKTLEGLKRKLQTLVK